ncbi:MAG: tryptophan 2,3-dioxygenase family protein [Saprospiraceae bacterium]|nr:tryptophan 2,3-dioxygenase family protein [Saprospiraceae bacterium]
MSDKYSSVHYHSYLDLDKILGAQHLRSAELGKPAHEEMLFIIVHQVYELWFKQIIHELASVMAMFEDDLVDEREIARAVARLRRVTKIQELMIKQITVIETMTPLDFLDFRNYLFPASGFQSYQFRVVEIMLGLRSTERLSYNEAPFHIVFDDEKRHHLEELERKRSLLELTEQWLERTPFLESHEFNFIEEYKRAVQRMLASERAAIMESDILTERTQQQRLRMLGDTDTYFATVLDPARHEELRQKGELKFSYKATIAALLIHLYREEPILQMPYQLLSTLMDIEEYFTTWRQRHAQMVLRMIGRKTGTGGSSGHKYLSATARQHQIFSDLYNISTLLIPRSELPQLPEVMKRRLGYFCTANRIPE